jgi:hypothetical protein
MKIAILFFTLLSASLSFAAELCSRVEPVVAEEFRRAFHNINFEFYPAGSGDLQAFDYHPEHCAANVLSLTRRFKYAKINLEEASVIYIFKRDKNGDRDSFYPQKSRGWTGDGWGFHVIMNYKGLILDMDYTNQNTPISIQDYFNDMFLSSTKNTDLLVKVIPAKTFTLVYSGPFAQYPRTFVNRDTDHLFPPQKLEDYLSRYADHACD